MLTASDPYLIVDDRLSMPRTNARVICVCVSVSRSNGSIGLDVAERFFASAATPTDATADKAAERGFRWPVEGVEHCGSPTCRASRKLMWRRSLSMPANGRLVRSDLSEVSRCALHAAGPLAIHFNGPLKGDWASGGVVSDWLVESLLEIRE